MIYIEMKNQKIFLISLNSVPLTFQIFLLNVHMVTRILNINNKIFMDQAMSYDYFNL